MGPSRTHVAVPVIRGVGVVSKMLVANDTGSKELVEPLVKLGIPAVATKLEFGDIAFMGRGEAGAPLYVGIELKKVGELVQSLRSKRLQGHQLLGLTRDFDRRYLLIEGDFHHDGEGRAVVYRGRGKPKPLAGAPNAIAFEQEIINIQTRGGCWVRHTTTRRDTLRFIQACYRYWTDKDLDEHKSHLAVYSPDLDNKLLSPPSDFRKALQVLLPGIGFAASKRIEEECWDKELQQGSFRQMMLRSESWWAGLMTFDKKGNSKRLGASRAKAIMEALK